MTDVFLNENSHQEILYSSSKVIVSPSKSLSEFEDKKSWGGCIPKRIIFTLVGFLATTLALTLNTNLSLAIVSMVDRSSDSIGQVKTSNECLSNQVHHNHSQRANYIRKGEFHWSPETEGFLIGCLYYGQLIGVLPGGRMAELYGGKRTLISFFLLASVCTFIAPFAARVSVYLFAVCRFLVGVGTAPVVPILFYLLSRWIPESERSLTSSCLLAGFGVGAFVSFLTAGELCFSDLFGGWPSVFYFGGLSGLLWCLLCYMCISERPIDHPSITAKELKYITENLGTTKQKKIKIIPWKSILRSKAFWSLAAAYFGQFWILGFFCSVQAFYMGTVLNMDSKMTGELSCLPHLSRALFACICGLPIDWALKKGYTSKEFVRKGATTLNSLFACIGFIGIIYAGCDPTLNTVFFTFGGLLADFITFGVCLNGVDIAPNLSGTLSAILTLVGVVPFFVIPALVGIFTKYERSRAQWRFVYYIIMGVVATTTLVFVFCGTSEPQDWGSYDDTDKGKDELETKLKPEEE
ncbi:putative inorganic phosphate cotransporter [Parasteatoda tepidariorum]|uniref:putative inorganic phosphate cotransporter n=1 Tax=Parasteatoda tepidariorum TaxID=114398 RepID=UPI001C72834F|nr:putative inorganic phosphate cotransporter [Parasteatoda tepidariorum]XP_042906544.1 putative inorganic phosphate cotransporter [Parasteatoda tepidariorum]